MRRFAGIALLLLLAGCFQPAAQPAAPVALPDDGVTTLSIQVVDSASNASLAGAALEIQVTGTGVYRKTTDSEGKATLNLKPAATCSVFVSRTGYASGETSLDCRRDQTLRLRLKSDGVAGPPPPPTDGPRVRITWTPDFPAAGDPINFEGRVENGGGKSATSWSWSWGDGSNTTGTGAKPSHAFMVPGDWEVTARASLTDGTSIAGARTVFVHAKSSGEPPPGNQTPTAPAPPPAPRGVFDCAGQTIVELYDTFGSDDSVPALAWASLKTGFRAVVVWTSEQPTTASLRFTVGRESERTMAETVPTRIHLFALDGLGEGQTVCFTPVVGGQNGPTHAMRLANAMNAYQSDAGEDGVYSLNLLALVNEGGDVAEVEEGMARFASMLWDATDGHVRAGATLVIVGDYQHHNSGWSTCYIPSVNSPICRRIFDVLFTEDAAPQGAASTYRQGIHDPDQAIWMNMHWQAFPGTPSLDDTGAVLMHEVGHYAFDMDDLYGDPVVPDSQDCNVGALGISIMGGSRAMTEFDDALHPCPSQPSGYIPSWTWMRGEFPNIPDRAAINPGPDGNGGIHLQRTYRAI